MTQSDMARSISRTDLIDARMNQFHGAAAITAAALVQGLLAFADADMRMPTTAETASDCLKERIGTTGDRWYGGCLLLAMSMAEVVDDLCDFEGGGVFTYEHIEVASCSLEAFTPANNLPAYLMQVVELDAWYDLSENWKKPSRECLEQVFKEWAELAGITVKTKLEKLQ